MWHLAGSDGSLGLANIVDARCRMGGTLRSLGLGGRNDGCLGNLTSLLLLIGVGPLVILLLAELNWRGL